jgi:dTDP-4-dehydrorhamnose reductase
MQRRVFILGERGQVARALAAACERRNDSYMCAGRDSIDVTDRLSLSDKIAAFRPDLIVNTAAYTQVDRAEDEAAQAFAINRDGAGNAAAAAAAAGAPIIHLSTDYVFDGAKPTPYVETDTPNPLGVYGRSKLEGEAAVMAETADYLILRTSWVYGSRGSNFVRTMLRLARERDAVRVVDDQRGSPTFAQDLADAVLAIGDARMNARHDPWPGIYHLTGTGETTWCGFARAIMAGSRARGGPACTVQPIATREQPTRAQRPPNSRLDCSKVAKRFGLRLPDWEVSLGKCLDQLVPAVQGSAT